MKLKIEKSRNKYRDTYYGLDVNIESELEITNEQFKTISDSMKKIADIIDPIINHELAEKEKEAKTKK